MPQPPPPAKPNHVSVRAGALKSLVDDPATVDQVLQSAWPLLVAALQYRTEDGAESAMPHLSFDVADGVLAVKDLANGETYRWKIAEATLAHPVFHSLAQELAEILNRKTIDDGRPDWGFHKNPDQDPV
jgi:hypothetical protein